MKQENWMDVEQYRDSNYALSSAFPALMRKVFVWMTLALAITGITAFGVATSPALISAIFGSKVYADIPDDDEEMPWGENS